jgi:hypothetical protein
MKGTRIEMDALDNIFGIKPKGAIFLPAHPYAVRFNCKDGQLSLGEDNHLGKEAEISIIKATRWFGDMGMTQGAEWLQLFYVGAPSCEILPKDTVCCSYIKTRSLSQFQQIVTKLLAAGENPAKGVFRVSFVDHVSGQNRYKSVKFEYRDRDGEDEVNQLQAIANFMAGRPALIDVRVQSTMQCVDGLSAEEVQYLLDGAKADRAALPAGK